VRIRTPRTHRADPRKRIADDSEALAKSSVLAASFDIPDAAAPLIVAADVAKRCVRVSMELPAPRDRARATASINWLTRQLKDADGDFLFIEAKWPGRAATDPARLSAVRNDPNVIAHANRALLPTSFVVFAATDDGRSFQGQRKFIELIESVTRRYYEQAGQHL